MLAVELFIDTNGSVTVRVLLSGESYIAMHIKIDDFIGCTVPVIFRITISYYLQNDSHEMQHEQKVIDRQFLYDIDSADKDGKSIILQNLHSNCTYLYSIFIHEGDRLKTKPQLGKFKTIENNTSTKSEMNGQC